MKKIINRSYASAFLLIFVMNFAQASPVMVGKVLIRTLLVGGVGSGVLYGNQQLATDNRINIDGPMLAINEQLQPVKDAAQGGWSVVQDGVLQLLERAGQLLPFATQPQTGASSDAIAVSGAPVIAQEDLPEAFSSAVPTQESVTQAQLPEATGFGIRQAIKPVLVVCAVVCVTYGAYRAYQYYNARQAKKA